MSTERIEQPGQLRMVLPPFRWVFLAGAALVMIGGIQLFLLSEQTDRYFAWTINPPLTAAFLGANFWGALALLLLSSREQVWANYRPALPAVIGLSSTMMLATLLHLDRFHLNSPDPLPFSAAWGWLAVYVLLPPVVIGLLFWQLRQPGGDPPRIAPMAGWARAVQSVQSVVLVVLGAGLLFVPVVLTPIWPWMLTPLTGRAVGAWLLSYGLATVWANIENDSSRTQWIALSYALVGGLQLLAVARYTETINWNSPAAAIYVLFLLSVVMVGVNGWLTGRAARRNSTALALSQPESV